MDIYPQSIGNMIKEDLIKHMCDTMEQTMGDTMLAEFCIKTFDKISLENPQAVMKSQAITMSLNMIDFFDVATQAKILTLLLNCCNRAGSEEEFNQYFMNMIPQLCPMLSVHSDGDQARAEKVSTIFYRMAESFTFFYSPSKHFEQLAALWNKFAETGAINCIMDCLKTYAHDLEANELMQKASADEGHMDFEMITTQNIGSQKKTYTDATLSNFFKLLTIGSKFSLLLIDTIINSGAIESLEKLLPHDDHQPGYINDLASLLNQILPQTEDVEHNRQTAFIFGPGQNYPPSTDPNSQYQLIKKATQALEVQKKDIYNGLTHEFHIFCASKILPKLFGMYRRNMSIQFRTRCLNIIDKILGVLPNEVLQDHIEALPLSQFVLQIFSNGRAT